MSAHTPGPWKALKATVRGETTEWFVTDDDDEGVAVIASCVTDKTGEPSEANARLIAAAPELLEALEGLCGLAELRPGHLQDYKAAVAAARAAIAKAKGGAA